MAADIQREAEEPEVSGKTVEEAEARAAFLVRELNYNDQLVQTLRAIKAVTVVLDEVEQARAERRILDALHLLESTHTSLPLLVVARIADPRQQQNHGQAWTPSPSTAHARPSSC